MVEGRIKQASGAWLAARPQPWREGIEVVATVPREQEVPPGFTGYKTATIEQLPGVVAVMDPFHVVRLAGDGPERSRRRIQQDTTGHRGRGGDLLYAARRVLCTGAGLLTDRKPQRLMALSQPTSTSRSGQPGGTYQLRITAYRDPDRAHGRVTMTALIESLGTGGLPA